MPLAPRSSTSCAKMRTTLSAWTPLNHPLFNSKVFEERRILLTKWFDRWSDGQRRTVLQDFVLRCSPDQLMFLGLSVSRRLPLQAADFTCLLPRALSLYIFSFLDPRSLSRCAQVSWHWKNIVELDQLWMPKCLKLGWSIPFSPTPFEQGVWKRHYIQTVQELRLTYLQRSAAPNASALSRKHNEGLDMKVEVAHLREGHAATGNLRLGGISKKKKATVPPPWRDSDRHPEDTRRFNYLDNLELPEQELKRPTKEGGAKRTSSEAKYKLRKAKSLVNRRRHHHHVAAVTSSLTEGEDKQMFLSSNCRPQNPPPPHEIQSRPSWAARAHDHPVTKENARSMLRTARWNAGICPGPARAAVPQLSAEALRASQRSHRSAPSTPLFDTWIKPTSHS